MDVTAILEELDGLGVKASVAGDRLWVEPGSRVPAELMAELRRYKSEVISVLKLSERHSEAEVTRRLQEALKRKGRKIVSERTYLFSVHRPDPERLEGEISHLEGQIAEIQRYIKEGGALGLPRCCRQAEWICLLATRGLSDCAMVPECGFSLRL